MFLPGPQAALQLPIFTALPQSVVVLRGGTAVFEWAAYGNPEPYINWFKTGTALNAEVSKVRTVGSSLQIQNVQPEAAGVYACSAQNFVGTNNVSATLKVRGTFNVCLGIIVLSSQGKVLVCLWTHYEICASTDVYNVEFWCWCLGTWHGLSIVAQINSRYSLLRPYTGL